MVHALMGNIDALTGSTVGGTKYEYGLLVGGRHDDGKASIQHTVYRLP